jgi:heat shock protein 1/8
MEKFLGISIGTSNICAAVFDGSKAETIKNDIGNKTTPTIVAFTDQEILIGEAACGTISSNESNTIPDVPKLIGRKYDDPELKEEMKQFNFTVINKNGFPSIEVEYKQKKIEKFPYELLADIFKKIKADAKFNEGEPRCALSKPHDASTHYIYDIEKAAKEAKFNVVSIESEPNLAILGSDIINQSTQRNNVFILDIGSTTCTASVATIEGSSYKIINSETNKNLGGRDFDEKIIEEMSARFKNKTGSSITEHQDTLKKLRNEAEKTKKTLSAAYKTSVTMYNQMNSKEITEDITRDQFEAICSDLFGKITEVAKKAIANAKMEASDINTIICVGGTSTIPRISTVLAELMKDATIHKINEPIEVIALGAAIKACTIANPELLYSIHDVTESKDLVNYCGLESGDDESVESE